MGYARCGTIAHSFHRNWKEKERGRRRGWNLHAAKNDPSYTILVGGSTKDFSDLSDLPIFYSPSSSSFHLPTPSLPERWEKVVFCSCVIRQQRERIPPPLFTRCVTLTLGPELWLESLSQADTFHFFIWENHLFKKEFICFLLICGFLMSTFRALIIIKTFRSSSCYYHKSISKIFGKKRREV